MLSNISCSYGIEMDKNFLQCHNENEVSERSPPTVSIYQNIPKYMKASLHVTRHPRKNARKRESPYEAISSLVKARSRLYEGKKPQVIGGVWNATRRDLPVDAPLI